MKICQRGGSPGCEILLGVDGDDDALAAEFLRGGAHEAPIGDGGRIDRDLIGAGEQEIADVLERAHAAADGERHEADFGGASDDVDQRAAVLVARGDVEKAQFVGARLVVGDGAFDGIAGVAQVDEIDALDDTAVLDVEAGDEAGFEHHSAADFKGGRLMKSQKAPTILPVQSEELTSAIKNRREPAKLRNRSETSDAERPLLRKQT